MHFDKSPRSILINTPTKHSDARLPGTVLEELKDYTYANVRGAGMISDKAGRRSASRRSSSLNRAARARPGSMDENG